MSELKSPTPAAQLSGQHASGLGSYGGGGHRADLQQSDRTERGFRPVPVTCPATPTQNNSSRAFQQPTTSTPRSDFIRRPPDHSGTPIHPTNHHLSNGTKREKSGCQSPGSEAAVTGSENSMIRRNKTKDDSRFREHRKCLGLTVLARRGDTFRQAQVIEIRDDGYIGVMMKGDSNLTFFLTQESGPKSPREGQGDVCMLINDQYDDQVTYQPSMRAAVNVGRDVYRECTIVRSEGDSWLVRIDSNGCSDDQQPAEKKVRSDQLRPFVPPWHSNRDNSHILSRLRTTSRGVEVNSDDNKMISNGSIQRTHNRSHEDGETDTASENDDDQAEGNSELKGIQSSIALPNSHDPSSRPSSVNSVSEPSGTTYQHKFRKGEVVTQNTGVRKKFNGKQWRRLCSKGDCIKESQRKGFCSRHLTDNKRSDTKRVSRPPSTTEPPQNNQSANSSGQSGQPSIHCTAQEVEAASILISLKNTPSRSATPHQGISYSPSPSPINRGLSPAARLTGRTPNLLNTPSLNNSGRSSSITPDLPSLNSSRQSFRTPNRINQSHDSGLDSLGPTPNPTVQYRSDISPAGQRGNTLSPPIITEGPVRITSDQHLRHDTAKPEPQTIVPQHISTLLPLFSGKQYSDQSLVTFPWHNLLPEFPTSTPLKQSQNSLFERPQTTDGADKQNGHGNGGNHHDTHNGGRPNRPTQGQNNQGRTDGHKLNGHTNGNVKYYYKTCNTINENEKDDVKSETVGKKREHIRRPMNAFMLFSKELRGEVHKANPKKDNRSVSKLLGEMWNGLSDAKKAHFQKQAADLKEKHYKDYPDWKWSNKDRKRNGKVNQKLFEKSDFSKNEYSTDSNESMKSYDSSISLQHVTPTMTNSSKPVPNHTQGHHQVHQMHQVQPANQVQMCPNRPGEVEICRTDIRLKRPRTIKPKEIDRDGLEEDFALKGADKYDEHEGFQFALTVDNQLIPIQCVVPNSVIRGDEWSTSSSRSCSSTSSSGICSTASSDESNPKAKVRLPIDKLRVENSPRRLVRTEEDQIKRCSIINNWGSNSVVPNEKCVGLLKRKSDSAFAPPNKQRKTEKDPNGGVSQFNTSESQIQSQNTDHCDQHENKNNMINNFDNSEHFSIDGSNSQYQGVSTTGYRNQATLAALR